MLKRTAVFRPGLGIMSWTLDSKISISDATELIKLFIDAGGNFIDTANVYCTHPEQVGSNESLIQGILSKINPANDVVVASKGGVERVRSGWKSNGNPDFIRQSCEQSLRHLKQDALDLYQLHAPDPGIPFLDTLGEFVRLRDDGLIKNIGLCNIELEQLISALDITEIYSIQNACSVLNQTDFNNGLINYCSSKNILYIAHSPLGGFKHYKDLDQCESLIRVANKYSTNVQTIALTWLMKKSMQILPIPGTTRVQHLRENINAVNIDLQQDEVVKLDED